MIEYKIEKWFWKVFCIEWYAKELWLLQWKSDVSNIYKLKNNIFFFSSFFLSQMSCFQKYLFSHREVHTQPPLISNIPRMDQPTKTSQDLTPMEKFQREMRQEMDEAMSTFRKQITDRDGPFRRLMLAKHYDLKSDMRDDIEHVQQEMQKQIASLRDEIDVLRDRIEKVETQAEALNYAMHGGRRQELLDRQELEESRVIGLAPKSPSDQGPEQGRDESDPETMPIFSAPALAFLASIKEQRMREEGSSDTDEEEEVLEDADEEEEEPGEDVEEEEEELSEDADDDEELWGRGRILRFRVWRSASGVCRGLFAGDGYAGWLDLGEKASMVNDCG